MNPLLRFSFGASLGRVVLRPGEDPFALYEPLQAEAHRWYLAEGDGSAGFGWADLPLRSCDDVLEAAGWLRSFEAVVQVGIGGSALGNLMLHQALLGDTVNERGPLRFYLADNPDPAKVREIWDRVKDRRTALVGVSKSGSTAETTSQFLWFKEQMECRIDGPMGDRILLVTDPAEGVFRAYVNQTGCRSLPIPSDVGGRYSVLSPSGLLSAAALGVDVEALLCGAREMRSFLRGCSDRRINPALRLAALHRYHERQGRPMAVFFPYSSRLERFAEWYAQLWAESLGKGGQGTTPIRALGAIDQHSQVQLYVDGPDDKFATFLHVGGEEDLLLPQVVDEPLRGLSYLGGRGLGEMLSREARATAAALASRGRPLVWIDMERLDARSLGQLVYFYEVLTAMVGRMMDLNPFDQPGVEQGKRYTYGLMGRKGFEEHAVEAQEWFARIDGETLEGPLGEDAEVTE